MTARTMLPCLAYLSTTLVLIHGFSSYPDWLEPKMSADFPFQQKFIDVYNGNNKSFIAYYELGPSDSED
eukprot:1249328-Pleurochrysis_carterae.AAC.1